MVRTKAIEFIPNSSGTMWITSENLGDKFNRLIDCVSMSGNQIVYPFYENGLGWGIKSYKVQDGSIVINTTNLIIEVSYK